MFIILNFKIILNYLRYNIIVNNSKIVQIINSFKPKFL